MPKKQSPALKRSKSPRPGPGKRNSRKKKKKPPSSLLQGLLLIGVESLGMTIIAMAAIIMLLGYYAKRFSGTDFFNSLLPFATGILALVVFTSFFLSYWMRLRKWLQGRAPLLPLAVVLGMTLVVCALVPQKHFARAYGYYRTLLGGKEEAGRVALAHQVYAAYRRLDAVQVGKMISRAQQYAKDIEEAAKTYDLDIDLLKGLAAAESSYLPRKSPDGGHGLFQITQTPASVLADVSKLFAQDHREMDDPRYNAFLGSATLRHYLAEMNDDLFLGLLAYNIGPANGGLRFIMQQYGATDFTTIQPYLLRLPRDYPIRVLSYALAFRVSRKEGRLLAYEEGMNAVTIQALGIPGQ